MGLVHSGYRKCATSEAVTKSPSEECPLQTERTNRRFAGGLSVDPARRPEEARQPFGMDPGISVGLPSSITMPWAIVACDFFVAVTAPFCIAMEIGSRRILHFQQHRTRNRRLETPTTAGTTSRWSRSSVLSIRSSAVFITSIGRTMPLKIGDLPIADHGLPPTVSADCSRLPGDAVVPVR